MTAKNVTWVDALALRDDLKQYGDNSVGLFALALRFGLDDIHSVAAESITDGSDDKKCDLIFIDREGGTAILAQCYSASKEKASAPANKASDLNTAIGWLLHSDINALPERIKSAAAELRKAIEDGFISRFEVWYIHNLPQSTNVQDELGVVEATAKSLIDRNYPKAQVSISALEVGRERLEEWYLETLSPILINDEISIDIDSGFSIQSGDWSAFVTAVPARSLYRLFKKYKAQLFSANVRDYLGSRKSDNNINHGIKTTVQSSPENFWAFNNGITVLTHDFRQETIKGRHQLIVKGLSIVNGAQTTGAIGSLSKLPDLKAMVPARFVRTANSDLIYSIIQYNNSQNKVTASDFRSTDRIQKRLREEVSKIHNAAYEGGRRGGSRDVIQRNKNLLPSYTVGQALAAFHQEPIMAYNQKSEIWVSDLLYTKFFNDQTSGLHVIFSYSLLRAVEETKRLLVNKSRAAENSLTEQENELLTYFRHRGSTYLLASAVASCIETFSLRRITSLFKVSFSSQVTPKQAIFHWNEIIQIVSPFCVHLIDGLKDGLNNSDRARKAISVFKSLVQATAASNSESYKKIGKNITIDR